MKRREFIKILTAAAAQAALLELGGCATAKPARTESSSAMGKVLLSLALNQDASILRYYDWASLKALENFTVPICNPHSILLDRENPHLVYLFEAFGSCLKMDLRTGESTKVDHLQSDSYFTGHGIQSTSGELLVCTEGDRKLGSIVTLRSARTLKRIAVAPRECNGTHQVVHLPHSDLVACGNLASMSNRNILGAMHSGKFAGGVTFYDYEKREVINRVDLEYPVLHLVPLSSTEILGGAVVFKWDDPNHQPGAAAFDQGSRKTLTNFFDGVTFLPGPLYYVNVDGTSRQIWDASEPDIFRFNFAIAPLPTPGMFISSHQISGKVLLWKDSKIIRRVDVDGATNLLAAKNGKEFMIRSQESLVKVFSVDSFEEITAISDPAHRILTLAAY